MSKSAVFAIIGRPSAGKSTLMNTLCGEKVSIVSPVPQTTRNKIRGIMNDARGQVVFLDTPGFHFSQRSFNRHLTDLIRESLSDCDGVLYLIDASRRPGAEENGLIEMLGPLEIPVLAVLNKSDSAGAEQMSQIEKLITEKMPTVAGNPLQISALNGSGLDELRTRIFGLAPEGEALYPEDYYTDQEPAFRISEIIRERATLRAREELPHALFVEIQDLEIRQADESSGKKEDQLWVRAILYVESESQVGLVVGKGGTGIKAIRTESQKEIGRLFPYRVHLDLRVKSRPRWRRNEHLLNKMLH